MDRCPPPDEHRIIAIREGDLFTFWCACGWMTRVGVVGEGFAYYDRHLSLLGTFVGA